MKVAVLGSGIAGLSAARSLAACGHRVTVLERSAEPGGKMRTESANGFLIEAGPDSFLADRPEAVRLCRDLGLGDELIAPSAPRRVSIYAGGALHPLPEEATFASLTTGLGALIERLEATLRDSGVELRFSTQVTGLAPTASGWRIDLRDSSGSGRIDSDRIVAAIPAFELAPLLAPAAAPAGELLLGIAHGSMAIVTLGCRSAGLPAGLGHGFLVAPDQPCPITACTCSSSKWTRRAPEGYALLRAYFGSAEKPVDMDQDDAALIGAARDGLHAVLGIEPEPVLTRVHRWPRAMPRYGAEHLELVRAVERELKGLPGIALAGASYRGLGIPDCIVQGFAAAEGCNVSTRRQEWVS